MAEETLNTNENVWPIPKFYFSINFGSNSGLEGIVFQEVSGLDVEPQAIEYRLGINPVFSTVKMPGIAKNNNITMKKGIFKNDSPFWEWHTKIKMNTITRNTVTVKLLDETGAPVMTWALANAWPTKVTSTDLKGDGIEVAVESIEFMHKGLVVDQL